MKSNKNRRAKSIRTNIDDGQGVAQPAILTIDEHPTGLLTPRFLYPTALTGYPLPAEDIVTGGFELATTKAFHERLDKLGRKVDLAPSTPTEAYHLMLAKIGHAYAAAERPGGFIPLLKEWIRGDSPYSQELCRFVGSEPLPSPPSTERHAIRSEIERGAKGEKFLVVRFRLFADLSEVTHVAVAGIVL